MEENMMVIGEMELWMAMESDRFLNPVLREFYKEKYVIAEERRMTRLSNPQGKLRDEMLATSFTSHPYGNSLIGPMSDIHNYYRPEALAQHRTLMAEVTLLKIDRDRDTGLYEISGSMRSSDIQSHGILGRHFYFIDYSVRGKRMRLVAEMTEVDARIADKIQFKTLKLPLSSEQQLSLESFIGVEQVGVYCEILPVLGTPCDLYSLGVIGLEVLFHGSEVALAQLKDQLRTLANACTELGEELSIVERIVRTFETESHLREMLMPDVLGLAHSGKDCMGLPPEERIWEGLLAIIMKMLSGLLKNESYAPSLSNENNFRITHVFDQPLSELGRYMAVLRSLNLGDTQSTRLVSEVLDEMIMSMGGSR